MHTVYTYTYIYIYICIIYVNVARCIILQRAQLAHATGVYALCDMPAPLKGA